MVQLTRKAEFSASHFYWVDSWSPEENQRAFGKCANRNGHGHNYTLEVTVQGRVDPVTGFVVDLKELKEILEREVVSVYDHRHLNHEVPEFRTMQPTSENIAIAIWRRLEGKIAGANLVKVRVYEMEDLYADYMGEA
ncbi:6-carboxytetrahydropterin synthase [Terriglobus albidus]|uniref:6-carboxy-5,6,7,8-tetrahydropterin synthase n=1 Tax=Terriglobus albidus TaxID=1592106 RepID=A0A5B9EH68_9BACT|nr:6-carboxytetrahydropterin synthase [Terriglobus albidus]QEE29687.1 6-carboxytetrahydropterin synthase [Terriglobus albidus]